MENVICKVYVLREVELKYKNFKRIKSDKIKSSKEVFDWFRKLRNEAREIMLVIYFDSKNAVIAFNTHSQGTVHCCNVHPREIVKVGVMLNASAIILIHNHPSGETEPSESDKSITRDILLVCKLLEMKLLDHIIIGDNKYYSMADVGIIKEYEHKVKDLIK